MTTTASEIDWPAVSRAIGGLPDREPPVLGRGVFGTVYDLGDATVLKVIAQGRGLGSAAEKFAVERRAYEALGGLSTDLLRIPKCYGSGTLDLSPAAGWLRLEKLPGTPLENDPDAEKLERLGRAIAAFQDKATASGDFDDLPCALERAFEEVAPRLADPRLTALAGNAVAVLRDHPPARPVAQHGDVNLVNVLDAGPEEPFGLLDFAEAGFGAPEADFRHFVHRPEVLAPIRAGYESAAPPLHAERLAAAAAFDLLATVAIRGAAPDRDRLAQLEAALTV